MKNKKIFLVDDDFDYLNITRSKLENMGFEVITAESQKDAEEKMGDIKADIAILDLMMEQEDSGFILSYKLKQKYPEMPVIIATSVTAETGYTFSLESEDEKRWIKADMYLDKGIRADQLHREIKKLLERQ